MQNSKLLTLADKGLLAHLRISRWHAYAFDERATRDVNNNNATADAGRFNKKLMTKSEALKQANASLNAVYAYHVAHTLPWFDEGPRILPATNYFDYQAQTTALINLARAEIAKLPLSWANDVALDARRLGALYNANDYPRDICSRFAARLDILPVPSASDFRTQVSEQDMERLVELEQEVLSNASEHLTTALRAPLQALFQRLGEYTGEGKQRWHQSIVENVLTVVDRLPSMNIAEDAKLKDLIESARVAVAPHAESAKLKDSPTQRAALRTQVAAILNKF